MSEAGAGGTTRFGGLAGWVIGRLRRAPREQPKLMLLEKMALAPRQSLALIEADGKRLLVATAADSAPAIYALDEGRRVDAEPPRRAMAAKSLGRVSW